MIYADLILAILGVAGVCGCFEIGRRSGFADGAKKGYAYAADPNDASLFEVRPHIPKHPQRSWVVVSPTGEHTVGTSLTEVTYRAAKYYYGQTDLTIPANHGNL